MKEVKSIGNILKRLPGQSLRERRYQLFDEQISDPLVMVLMGFVIFVIECLHVFGKIVPSVCMGAVIFVLSLGVAIWKIRRWRRLRESYSRGEEGERLVAQAIEHDLLPLGYEVFHDLQLEKDGRIFNIDHLLIGENGVFAIETKNYTKPKKGSPEVRYDGEKLVWAGKKRTSDEEIAQAKSAATSAKNLIEEVSGFKVFVKPVLCVVGWFVQSSNVYGHPVLLTMEKTLGSVIPKVECNKPLSGEERKKIVAALKRL